MPIIRANSKLIYYAHVPKCGGSAVENYLEHRFGNIAFVDTRHHTLPSAQRWSKTSPQHIDLYVLGKLFPDDFFDHSFAIVRHPVDRIISAYHFQMEIEQITSANMSFQFWLENLADNMADDPFIYDNHTRPMVDLVPEDAKLFYLEHGLDAMVPWLDGLCNDKAEPRAVLRVNERKAKKSHKVVPSKADLDLIAEMYAKDFERFGYEPGRKGPNVSAPKLSDEFIAERDAAFERATAPAARASVWLRDQISRVTRSPH